MRLQEKVAIITGGASGIGRAAVERFLQEGAKVVIADFDQAAGDCASQAFEAQGYAPLFIQVDVSDRESVENMIRKTIAQFGTVDILINNAGITDDATLLKMEDTQFDRVLDVNLKGVYLCTQQAVKVMTEKGKGKIINTSSVSGVYGNFGQTNYAAAKAAIIGMTKTWAKEFGRKGINVNAVAPGFTATDMVQKMPEKVVDQMKQNIAMHRLGKPEDIANAYLFLASDEANFVNGHVLHVDGGIMM